MKCFTSHVHIESEAAYQCVMVPIFNASIVISLFMHVYVIHMDVQK